MCDLKCTSRRQSTPSLLVSPVLLGLLVSCAPSLKVSWQNEKLAIEDPRRPGETIEVWYLEAFCRSGSTHRKWEETVLPHRTELLEASPDGSRIRLRSEVDGGVEVLHEIRAGSDEVDFRRG